MMDDPSTLRMLDTIGFERLLHTDSSGVAHVRFAARPEFAHTRGTTVQGGLIAAWLDNAMAHAVRARDSAVGISTLEMKLSYLERVGVAPVEARARVLRWGGSVVFLEADLLDEQGRVLVKANSTGKLLRPKAGAAPR
jgi:acyl-coenzyme A thioesterase PaaI-like protein